MLIGVQRAIWLLLASAGNEKMVGRAHTTKLLLLIPMEIWYFKSNDNNGDDGN